MCVCVCVCVCVCAVELLLFKFPFLRVLLSTLPPVTVKVGYISATSLALSTMHWFGFSAGHHQIEGISACKVM